MGEHHSAAKREEDGATPVAPAMLAVPLAFRKAPMPAARVGRLTPGGRATHRKRPQTKSNAAQPDRFTAPLHHRKYNARPPPIQPFSPCLPTSSSGFC